MTPRMRVYSARGRYEQLRVTWGAVGFVDQGEERDCGFRDGEVESFPLIPL